MQQMLIGVYKTCVIIGTRVHSTYMIHAELNTELHICIISCQMENYMHNLNTNNVTVFILYIHIYTHVRFSTNQIKPFS